MGILDGAKRVVGLEEFGFVLEEEQAITSSFRSRHLPKLQSRLVVPAFCDSQGASSLKSSQ